VSNKILIVEDDPALCELIREVVSSAGMDADGMTDSSKAAIRLKHEKFDAVFLDIRMPPPDGIELTKRIRSLRLNQSTPIVIITGEKDPGLMARAFQAGANLFLFKPVDRLQILKLIRIAQGPIERERRRFRRVKVNRKVSIQLGEDRLDGKTLDLSLNGIMVQVNRTFPVGLLVQVNVELWSGMPPVCWAAKVMRLIGKDCMGLQLENLRGDESEKLQNFLAPLMAEAQ
jgi:DNA-binding response OmpR family regulator